MLNSIFGEKLSKENCKFKEEYTFTVYVVSKQYAITSSKEPVVFKMNAKEILDKGLKLYFANAKQIGENEYTSVSNSRLFAIATSGKELEELQRKVYDTIEKDIDKVLDYRKDIGKIYIH